jgi:hypothetical protein
MRHIPTAGLKAAIATYATSWCSSTATPKPTYLEFVGVQQLHLVLPSRPQMW